MLPPFRFSQRWPDTIKENWSKRGDIGKWIFPGNEKVSAGARCWFSQLTARFTEMRFTVATIPDRDAMVLSIVELWKKYRLFPVEAIAQLVSLVCVLAVVRPKMIWTFKDSMMIGYHGKQPTIKLLSIQYDNSRRTFRTGGWNCSFRSRESKESFRNKLISMVFN